MTYSSFILLIESKYNKEFYFLLSLLLQELKSVFCRNKNANDLFIWFKLVFG